MQVPAPVRATEIPPINIAPDISRICSTLRSKCSSSSTVTNPLSLPVHEHSSLTSIYAGLLRVVFGSPFSFHWLIVWFCSKEVFRFRPRRCGLRRVARPILRQGGGTESVVRAIFDARRLRDAGNRTGVFWGRGYPARDSHTHTPL